MRGQTLRWLVQIESPSFQNSHENHPILQCALPPTELQGPLLHEGLEPDIEREDGQRLHGSSLRQSRRNILAKWTRAILDTTWEFAQYISCGVLIVVSYIDRTTLNGSFVGDA
ncbi:hypothetical protein CLAIMM_08575 [Cladophialophora immunda]|nr:hypothetical protein CLAIMM_08575 [Cladophialophora immunda]